MTNWKDIHKDFTEELQKEWEEKGFTAEQTKEWIDVGMGVNDIDYVCWLRDVKQKDADWVLNHGNDKELREEYAKFVKEDSEFCCEHARKVQKLIQRACRRMTGESEEETSEGGKVLRTFIPWASNYDKIYLTKAIKNYKEWMAEAKDFIRQAEREMSACDCSRREITKMREEISQNTEANEINSNLREMLKDRQDRIKREEDLYKEKSERLKEKEEQLEVKNEKLEKTISELNDLRVKDQELIIENIYLKGQIKELKQHKLRSQEEKLQRLIWRRRGIEKEEVEKLRAAYEKFEKSSQSEEWNEARIEKDNLEKNIEDKLLTNETDLEVIHAIFRSCEDVAKTQVEFQAFIETPPRN